MSSCWCGAGVVCEGQSRFDNLTEKCAGYGPEEDDSSHAVHVPYQQKPETTP
jgi:hypothetical protein